MHNFKIKPGASKVYVIDKINFENVTNHRPPYYRINQKNEWVQYAVCPVCDNPIQIIGLYKKLKNTDRPYGKHYLGSIAEIAQYNQQAYDYCPYACGNTQPPDIDEKKHELTDFERNIRDTVWAQFDRVIYILSKETDIYISTALAKKMLNTYNNGEGWLYPWATLNNIPWIFGHLTWNKNLYGQMVRISSDLYRAILQNCPQARFAETRYKGYAQLLSAPGEFLDIGFCIINHQRGIVDDELVESVVFRVTEGEPPNDRIIYEKVLQIDQTYFLNLINLPEKRGQRNFKMLAVAEEVAKNQS